MIKEQIIFKCIVGSKLYGTNNENSDTDIKGVFLPDLNDLILGKAPKHYTFSSGSKHDRNDKDDVDETYYSLQYFLELAAKGDTNAIDLLFAYTNKNVVLQSSPIWEDLIKNIDKIITKNVNAYVSYCKHQAFKYSVKGEKLNNFSMFEQFCEKYIKFNDGLATLKEAIEQEFCLPHYPDFINNIIKNINVKEKMVFYDGARFNFGDHCYIIVAENKEAFIQISDVKFQLLDTVKTALYKVKKVIGSYGKRAENAAAQNGADYKAISHCVRVLTQVEELLLDNKITFPLKNADFIKSIKFNETDMTYEQIMEYIEKKINRIENALLPKSDLRDKADYKWIEQFILNIYEERN